MADVAVLGAGRMGAAMAARLVAAGHRVRVWNRSPAAAAALVTRVGSPLLTSVDRPEQAAEGADVVLATLADGRATQQVLLAPELLAVLAPEVVVADLGTSGVEAAHALSAGLGSVGAAFVDAPVSGSVATVEAGQLLVMAGGDQPAVDRLAPVLRAFAKRVVRVGEPGAGQVMKLAVNLVVHDLNTALSEALALAAGGGIDPTAAYDVFEDSVVAAPFVRYKRSAFLDEDPPVAMSLALVAKDLGLVTELARRVDVAVPLTEAAAHGVAAAVAAGFGHQDMATLRRCSPTGREVGVVVTEL